MVRAHERKKAAVLGALVGDAAALGLHWIYAQPRIRKVAPETPEFQEPKAEHYEDVPGYFAHERKHAGDSTMYGEYVSLTLRSLAAKGGAFHLGDFLTRFRAYFGPGGDYIGYADGPMRGTLFNAELMTREIAEKIEAMDLPVSEERHKQFARYISGYFFEGDAGELKAMLRSPFDLYKTTEEEYKVLDEVVDAVQQYRRPPGPEDAQMPALAKVAPIVALYAGSEELLERLETAVRATNNSDLAVAYATGLARALEGIVLGTAVEALGNPGPDTPVDPDALVTYLEECFSLLPEENRITLSKALSMLSQETKAITLKFGPACDCAMGVPSALHNLATNHTFVEQTRVNIWACGDSAGRAMILGSLSGALYGIGGERGIPEDWISRTRAAGEAKELLDKLIPR
ncbi:MAG: ADP-ribosylglycohydrolase family protein [Alkalispirochaetaceae bacterium]